MSLLTPTNKISTINFPTFLCEFLNVISENKYLLLFIKSSEVNELKL